MRGRSRHVRERADHVPRDRWLVSYADLVTLLFALFVVLYAAADSDRAKRVVEAISLEMGASRGDGAAAGAGVLPSSPGFVETAAAVDRAFAANEALRSRAKVTVEERGLVISLAEAGFFAAGTAEVRDDALATIDTLVASLVDSDAPVRVEGHTDSTPISTARYPSNWELSAARASAVAARLMQRGVAPARVSIAGFGGERPVADNATPDGRAQNRRVDIVILRQKS